MRCGSRRSPPTASRCRTYGAAHRRRPPRWRSPRSAGTATTSRPSSPASTPTPRWRGTKPPCATPSSAIGGISDVSFERVGTIADDPADQGAASLLVRTTVTGEERAVGRPFGAAIIELALANIPGFYGLSLPGAGTSFGTYWPAVIDQEALAHRVTLPDGSVETVPPPGAAAPAASSPQQPTAEHSAGSWGETRRAPLGLVADARSGDKGGDANVGVWVRDRAHWDVAARHPDGRRVPSPRRRVRRPRRRPLRAAQRRGPQLRRPRAARRGSDCQHAGRQPGQGARRVPPRQVRRPSPPSSSHPSTEAHRVPNGARRALQYSDGPAQRPTDLDAIGAAHSATSAVRR